MPVFRASHVGSFSHCLQVGSASLRRPPISSSRKVDQIVIAACPAKYVARVESTVWVPCGESFWASVPYSAKVWRQAGLSSATAPPCSTIWQLLPSANDSKVCWVKGSEGSVASVIPYWFPEVRA